MAWRSILVELNILEQNDLWDFLIDLSCLPKDLMDPILIDLKKLLWFIYLPSTKIGLWLSQMHEWESGMGGPAECELLYKFHNFWPQQMGTRIAFLLAGFKVEI